MDETLLAIMEIAGPVILLVILLWVVMRRGSTRRPDKPGHQGDNARTEAATDRLYDEEERRRREGTDDL